MNIYIGIDPSINSTGVCIQKYNDKDILKKEYFFIIKPNKLTKKEEKINIVDFQYLLYNKIDLSIYKNSHEQEYYKTMNILSIMEKIDNIINQYTHKNDHVTIIMEGISYGSSLRTKSIFDLAGLNYLLRYTIINHKNVQLCICPPAEIKKFASGKGNSDKDILCEAFLVLYPQFEGIKKIDDIVDAYFMCKYGVEYFKHMESSFKIHK